MQTYRKIYEYNDDYKLKDLTNFLFTQYLTAGKRINYDVDCILKFRFSAFILC